MPNGWAIVKGTTLLSSRKCRSGTSGLHPRYIGARQIEMDLDFLDVAIDEILAAADGDTRRALRAVLIENIHLEAELRHLYAVSVHGRRSETKNLQ
jgi:hypothetical protein